MAFEKPPVVIDDGSYNIKAGFGCDNHPVSMFRTVVGRPKYLKGAYGREYYDVHIGDTAMERLEDLDLQKPIVDGRIVHWDNMERIWHHTFYKELKVAPEDRVVILGCSPTTPITEKIKSCEIFFEMLNSPGLCVQSQSVLALYGSGLTTGMTVDLGYDTTDICPGYEGGAISYAHMRTGVAAAQLSNFLRESLYRRGYDLGFNLSAVIEGILRDHCYITSDSEMKCNEESEHKYKLPSGEEIDVSQEAFAAADLIFHPEVLSEEALPLHEAVVTSAMKCDADLRTEMFDSVVLCGGLAMLPGIAERLQTEMEVLTQKSVTIMTSTEPYAVAWLGGAAFAGMPDVHKLWVMKNQYEEYGEKIIRNKFL